MTGFGRASVEVAGVRYAVEVRSVNHRYLDLKTRLPRALAPTEGVVRERVGHHASRGRVDVVVAAVAGDQAGPSKVELNLPLARAVRDAHAEVASALGIPDRIDSGVVAAWPGVLQSVPVDVEDDTLGAVLGPALDAALSVLVEMRKREGAALAADLGARLDTIAEIAERVADRAPEQSRAYRERLLGRLRDLLSGLDVTVEEGRVVHEVAVFAEKADIAEEVSRLRSHVDQARGLLAQPDEEAVGRRLDFLCQEMFREANTVASKVQDRALSALAIDMKAELERLREQVQNVE